MLTREAFNALLKTLEEPPEHVIFILATTEAHKLPETIISRTQRFTFKPIEAEKAVERLAEIAKNEKFNISKDALKLIAEHSGGSFRDSISLLDQVASGSKSVTKEDVEKVLGIAPEAAVNRLEKVLVDGTAQDVIALLGELNEQGFHAGQLAKQLAERLRRSLLEGSVHLQPAILTQTLDRLLGVTASHDPNSALEIALLDVVLQNDHEPSVVNHKAGTLSSESDVAKKSKNNEPTKKAQSLKQEVQGTATPSEIWPKALDAIKSRHNTLYSIARMAVPTFEGNTLTLSFGFPFHQKRMNETKNVILVREIINEITGQPIEVISTVDPGQKNKISVVKPEVKPVDEGSLGAISNIFGGAEVLE
jgi:DNA polymerase-3 subunit gamma/tau